MLAAYAGVVVLLLAAIVSTGGVLAFQAWLGRRRKDESETERREPAPPLGAAAVPFHRAALWFVVALAGGLLLALWAATSHETGVLGLVAIAAFALPWLLGLVWAWAKGGLEW